MNQILEQLEINNTFFYQFVLFGAFFFLMSRVYMRPIQHFIEKRNHKLKDDIASSEELLKTIESQAAKYEDAISKAKATASRDHEQALEEVRAQEAIRLNQHKEELKKEFLKLSHQLQEERLKVESELKLQLGQASDTLVQKILGGNG